MVRSAGAPPVRDNGGHAASTIQVRCKHSGAALNLAQAVK